ncbi:MAG: MFS transporter [Pseudomonadota bacterium]
MPEIFCPPNRRHFVLIASVLASSMGFIDGTIVSIALPAMRESLNAGLFQAQWFQNAYMLFLSALILLGGAMGDRYGTSRVFRLGIIGFVIASLLCAFAPTAELFILARACKGAAAAFMIPGSLAMLSRAYPEEDRGRAIGLWAAASAVTTASGPIVGGLLLSFGDVDVWRFIFAINLPLGIIAVWVLSRAQVTDTHAAADHPLDIAGALAATVSLGAIAYGFTLLDQGIAKAGPVLAGGGVVLVAFIWIETRAAAPMLPMSLFRNRAFSAANAATLLLYGSLSVVLLFLPMTVVSGWDLLEIEAAFAFAPLSIFIALLSSRVGRLADTYGPRALIAAGAVCATAGYCIVAATAEWIAFWTATMPGMTLVGIGMAAVVAPLSTAVMKSAPDDLAGAASGVNNAVSRIAGLLGVAIAAYLAARLYDGDLSFAAAHGSDAHIAETNAAFAGIAYLSAIMAFAASVIAWFGIGKTVGQSVG